MIHSPAISSGNGNSQLLTVVDRGEFDRFQELLQRKLSPDLQLRSVGILTCHPYTDIEQVQEVLQHAATGTSQQDRALTSQQTLIEPADRSRDTSAADSVISAGFVFESLNLNELRSVDSTAHQHLAGVVLVVEPNLSAAEELRAYVASVRQRCLPVLGILMLEPEMSSARRGWQRNKRGSRGLRSAAEFTVLSAKELQSLATRLLHECETAGTPLVTIAVDNLRAAAGNSMSTMQRLLAYRSKRRNRLGISMSGSWVCLLPDTTLRTGTSVANDMQALLHRLEPEALWSVRVAAYPCGAEANSEKHSSAPQGVTVHKTCEALFAVSTPIWKRSMDIAFATTGLIALAPLLFVAALLIKTTSRGPVFFSQWRAGHGGKPFRMLKFRTMVAGAEKMQSQLRAFNEQDGPAFKIRRDPRTTLLGKLLRRMCIDELPQLWNVLRGEMSLVGPRPLPLSEQAAASDQAQQRLRVLPGMTCYWQAAGCDTSSFAEWIRLDLQYVQDRSLPCDLKLLIRTLRVVIPFGRRAVRQAEPRSCPPANESIPSSTEGNAYVRS